MKPQHHGPQPFVALVAGVSFALWLVISAGLNAAVAHPLLLPQPAAMHGTSAVAPMPSPGPELTFGDAVR